MAIEPTPATNAETARRWRTTYLGPVLCVALCLLLLPAFTVAYVAWSQDQNNHKFCATVNAVIAPPPPAGLAKTNPSRAYDQDLHAAFMGLKMRLGC